MTLAWDGRLPEMLEVRLPAGLADGPHSVSLELEEGETVRWDWQARVLGREEVFAEGRAVAAGGRDQVDRAGCRRPEPILPPGDPEPSLRYSRRDGRVPLRRRRPAGAA